MRQIAEGTADLLAGVEAHLAERETAVRSDVARAGSVRAYLARHYGEALALTVPEGASVDEFVAGTTDAGMTAARDRLSFCAKCPTHGGLCDDGQIRDFQPGHLPIWSGRLTSSVCQKWPVHVLRRRLRKSGVPERMLDARLDTYAPETKLQRSALAECERFVGSFDGSKGLMLSGPALGVGKTHLAVGILAALLDARAVKTAMFVLSSQLLQVARTTAILDREEGTAARDRIRAAMSVDLLVLDDLGAHKTSDWVHEQMHALMDTRWSDRKATILTSNHASMKGLTDCIGARAMSRLVGMTRAVLLDGKDRRAIR